MPILGLVVMLASVALFAFTLGRETSLTAHEWRIIKKLRWEAWQEQKQREHEYDIPKGQ
jgi:hypothetical protein